MSLTIKIPNLLKIAAPLRFYNKNKFLEVGQESRSWINSYVPNNVATFDSNQFDILSAYMNPFVSKKNFRIVCDLNNWFFFYDDVAETSTDSGKIADEILTSIEDFNERSDSAFGKCTRDLLKRVQKISSKENFERFKVHLAEYVANVPQESKWFREGSLVGFDDCCKTRSKTIGYEPTFIMNSITHGIEIDKQIYETGIHQKLFRNASTFGFMLNDLLSYPKDYVIGSNINIVSILMREKNLNHQEAIDEATKIIQDEVQDFLYHRAKLIEKFSTMQKGLKFYIRLIEVSIQGASKYYYESNRYKNLKLCDKFTEKLKRDLGLNEVKIIFE